MKYPSLYRLFPSYFKIVGFSFSFIAVAMAVYLKLMQEQSILFLNSRETQILFLASLLICANSREKIEDERAQELRLNVFYSGFIFIVYSFVGDELLKQLGGVGLEPSMFFWVTTLTLYLTLYYELHKRFDLNGWIEKRVFPNGVISLVAMSLILWFVHWLWVEPTI